MRKVFCFHLVETEKNVERFLDSHKNEDINFLPLFKGFPIFKSTFPVINCLTIKPILGCTIGTRRTQSSTSGFFYVLLNNDKRSVTSKTVYTFRDPKTINATYRVLIQGKKK